MKILLSVFALGAALAVPTRRLEHFNVLGTIDNKTFVTTYSNTKLNWNEASTYCESKGWTMAKITSNAQAEFLKSVYNPVNFNGWYWVGAQLNENGDGYIWTETGETVATFKSLHTLTWADKEEVIKCLCYSSNNHENGYYFRRACHNKHLILCESLCPVDLSNVSPIRKPELVEVGTFQGRSYFGDNVIRNWSDSEAFCSSKGLQLVSLRSTKGQIQFLQEGCKKINFDGWFWVENLQLQTVSSTRRRSVLNSDNCQAFDAQDGSSFLRKCYHRHFTLCESLKDGEFQAIAEDSQKGRIENVESYPNLNANQSYQYLSNIYKSLNDKLKMELLQMLLSWDIFQQRNAVIATDHVGELIRENARFNMFPNELKPRQQD